MQTDFDYEARYYEGYGDGLTGARDSDNPYPQGTKEAEAWRDGQSDGNDDAVSAGY